MTEAEQGKSPENPWPVRAVATRVAKYIDRLGMVWVEGQLTELKLRQSTAWMVLRDPAADMSLSVSCPRDLVAGAPVPLSEGTQVIMLGKPQFYTRNGSFSLRVSEIRAVGVGELLARIERLRKLLDAEGLFDPRLKRPIPFLPNTIGLITGRASAAERDVMTVANRRWPAVRFAVRNTVVQGPNAVPQIVEALRELDTDPAVDVIVMARGGGSVEDLLPFSDETLCRAISACTTPVISAVGHEPDNPLCDLVADLRAATPTDAAKHIVPDAAAEQAQLLDLRRRSARALRNWVHREQHVVSQLRNRPVTGPAAGRAGHAVRRDSARQDRRQARCHAAGDHRVGAGGPPVCPADHAGTGRHPGPRLRGRADGAGRRRGGGAAQGVRRALGNTAADTRVRRGRHSGKRGKSMKPISELGYEEARDELVEVVRQLEQGGLDLDASLKLWERGEELARRCEEHLAGARKRIEDALAAGGDEES